MKRICFVHPYEWAAMMMDEVNKPRGLRIINDDYEDVQFDFNQIRFRVIGRDEEGNAYIVSPRVVIPAWVVEKLDLKPEDL